MVIHFFYWLSINWGGAALQQGRRGPQCLEIKRNHRWAGPLIESPGQSFGDCSVNDYMRINKDGSFTTWDVNIRYFLCNLVHTLSLSRNPTHTSHQMKQTCEASAWVCAAKHFNRSPLLHIDERPDLNKPSVVVPHRSGDLPIR